MNEMPSLPTTLPQTEWGDGPPSDPYTALVALYVRGCPELTGTTLAPALEGEARAPGVTFIVGRLSKSDTRPRLAFHRLRPEGPEGPLHIPREVEALSRTLFSLEEIEGPGLRVRRLTGPAMSRIHPDLGERSLEEGVLLPGDLLEVSGLALFLCVTRDLARGKTPGESTGAFGAPDDWGLTGESPAMWALRRQLDACRTLDEPTLIYGPPGSGIWHVAQALHRRSPLKDKPLLRLSALASEAELTGWMAQATANLTPPATEGVVAADIRRIPVSATALLAREMVSVAKVFPGERPRCVGVLGLSVIPPEDLGGLVLDHFPMWILLLPLAERREDIPLIARALARRHRRLRSDPEGSEGADTQAEGDAIPMSVVKALMLHPYEANVHELSSLVRRWLMGTWPPPEMDEPDQGEDLVALLSDRLQAIREDFLSANWDVDFYVRCGGFKARQTGYNHLDALLGEMLRLAKLDAQRAIRELAGVKGVGDADLRDHVPFQCLRVHMLRFCEREGEALNAEFRREFGCHLRGIGWLKARRG